jgi:hypothetical protein
MAGTVLKLDHKVSTTTIVNTTAETDLLSSSIPGNALSIVGNKIRVELVGDILNNTGAADTVLLKFKYGTTTILTTKAISLGASTNRRKWRAEIELIAETSSAQRCSGMAHVSEASSDTWATDEASGVNVVGYGTAAEATSSAKDVKVTATLGSASANLEITCKMGTVELLR